MMNSAGVYVHVPYCRGKCAYCSFISTVNGATQKQYVDALRAEIRNCPYNAEIRTVYFGGGTPSCLYRGAIGEITSEIRKKFCVDADAEFTVEANPESATSEFFDECIDAGVNRLSIGLQCADDEVLKKAGRLHTTAGFISAVESARVAGFGNISADLIIGLEGETRSEIEKSLSLLASLDVNHISVYSLSVEKGSFMFSRPYRPNEDKMADDYTFTSAFLKKEGFNRYEISNFAKKGFESRHNLGYWLHKPYLGFGPSAHSFFGGKRFSDTENLAAYLKGVTCIATEEITLEQLKEEYIMLRLRLERGIDLCEYENLFGEKIQEIKKREINRLTAAGVVAQENGRLFATEKGIYVLNYIITELI